MDRIELIDSINSVIDEYFGINAQIDYKFNENEIMIPLDVGTVIYSIKNKKAMIDLSDCESKLSNFASDLNYIYEQYSKKDLDSKEMIFAIKKILMSFGLPTLFYTTQNNNKVVSYMISLETIDEEKEYEDYNIFNFNFNDDVIKVNRSECYRLFKVLDIDKKDFDLKMFKNVLKIAFANKGQKYSIKVNNKFLRDKNDKVSVIDNQYFYTDFEGLDTILRVKDLFTDVKVMFKYDNEND